MTNQAQSSNAHLPFIVLLGLIMLCVPIEAVIDVLALRPYYSAEELLLEPWRLLSGHFVHASWSHLFINLINIILLRFVFREWIKPKPFTAFIIFSALFISIGLWITTDFTSYVGFSGIFHGLLIYLLLLYRHTSPIIFSIAGVCVLGKILYEQLYGASSTLADFIGVGIAIDAHALGFVSGLVFYLVERAYITYRLR